MKGFYLQRNILAGIMFIVLLFSFYTFGNDSPSFIAFFDYDLEHSTHSVWRSQDDDYAPNDSIYIDSEIDFFALGIPGTGSSDDPYIISNLWIDSGEPAIEILNVEASFIITDCLLWSDNSISIHNCQDFIIEDNDVRRYNGVTGIFISDSNDFVIRNNAIVPDFPNTVFTSFEMGIFIDNCRDFRIEENNIDRCTNGMEIYGYAITIRNNVISGRRGTWGIYGRISDSLIVDNTITKYQEAISLLDSTYNEISDNTCNDNDRGIGIWNSGQNNITSNICSDNEFSGIVLSGASSENMLKENRLVRNTEYGLRIDSEYYAFGGESSNPQGNQIFRNVFIDNNGGDIQAYDSGGGNGFGYNYWSDWIYLGDADDDGFIDEPYPILGGQVSDIYPLANEELALSLDIESILITPGFGSVRLSGVQITIIGSLAVIIFVPNLVWYVDGRRQRQQSEL